ncbi:MAG: serine hydrolase [Flavobacteriales bacterium]|nr:serine hydrolase [Flavobacteriales bacterium]
MKFISKVFWGLICLLFVVSTLLILTGNSYIFKAVANTYLLGRSGPSIDEKDIFSSRKIDKGVHQPWEESANINSQEINEKYLKEFDKYGTIAFLVIKKGEIISEQYWGEYNNSSLTNSFSIAKTVVSILVGIAIKEGNIRSVDDPVGKYLPAYNEGKNSELTIRHLLTMSSGINFDEDYTNPFAYPAKAYYGNDLRKLTANYRVTEEPGTVFKYLSGNTQILQQVLKEATGMEISQYASEKLWKPIGAGQDAFWNLDHEDGNEKAYCCIYSNVRDFARLGQLYLKKGKWNGNQIVPRKYAIQSVVPAQLIEEDGPQNNRYGYSWWMFNYNDQDIFYARGILGQYIIVIPDEEMVVVRLGHKRSKVPGAKHPADVFTYIDAALTLK